MSNLARSIFDRCHNRLLNLSPRTGRTARFGLLTSFAVLAALMMGTVAFTANLGVGPAATLFGTAVPQATPPDSQVYDGVPEEGPVLENKASDAPQAEVALPGSIFYGGDSIGTGNCNGIGLVACGTGDAN